MAEKQLNHRDQARGIERRGLAPVTDALPLGAPEACRAAPAETAWS